MSLERVLNTLMSFGLKKTDAHVYIYLAKKGPKNGRDLSNALRLTKQQLYPCLKCLLNKGIISATSKRPAVFSAVPFEEALDLLVQAKLEEAQHTQQNTDKALSDWQFMVKRNNKNHKAKATENRKHP